MTTRPLTWNDVKCEPSLRYDGAGKYIPWLNRNGENRVSASLRNCSFVNFVFWIKNFDVNSPSMQALILLKLHKQLQGVLKRLEDFVQ